MLSSQMQPLPCEPPPGLQQVSEQRDAAHAGPQMHSASAAKAGRQRDRASQNRSNNSAWKDNRAPAAVVDKAAVGVDTDDAERHVFQPYHSMSVPKKRDLEVSYGGNKAMTTVMLRNIPNKYTQGSLLQEIDCTGFIGTYNFFYLPMDIHNRTNVGYAFINFASPGDMQAFFEAFTDYKFKRHQSQKIARVSPAHIQGFLENVCHFSSCAVTRSRNSQYRPIVAYHGQLRDLAEVLLELSHSTALPSRHSLAERVLAPEVLASLESGVFGTRANSGLNPAAAEFVPAGGAFTGFDPSAEAFVPQAASIVPVLGASPAPIGTPVAEKFKFQTTVGDTSFTEAKKGLEDAVSMWLSGGRTTDGQSTEGGESGSSHDDSPRSSSDKEATSPPQGESHQDALGVSRTILGNMEVGTLIGAQ